MSLPKLRIDCPGPVINGRNCTVTLDGQEIPALRSLQLVMHYDEISEVTLTIAVDEVQVTAAAEAALRVQVDGDDRSLADLIRREIRRNGGVEALR